MEEEREEEDPKPKLIPDSPQTPEQFCPALKGRCRTLFCCLAADCVHRRPCWTCISGLLAEVVPCLCQVGKCRIRCSHLGSEGQSTELANGDGLKTGHPDPEGDFGGMEATRCHLLDLLQAKSGRPLQLC